MGAIKAKNFVEGRVAFILPTEAEEGLRAQEGRSNVLPFPEILIEQEHGGQRCGEVIDLRCFLIQSLSIGQDLREEGSGLMLAAQAAESHGAPVCHF